MLICEYVIKQYFVQLLLISLPSATKLRRLCFYSRVSVHRGAGGWGCLPQCMLGCPPSPIPGADTQWEQTPPGADTSQSRHPQSRHPPQADPPGSRHPPREQTPPRSRHPPGADTPPRYGHCCGRYASYWNAFLLFHIYYMTK